MKSSSKVVWIGTVFTTIVIAAVAGIIVYFTAFNDRDSTTSPSTQPPSTGGGDSSPAPPGNESPPPVTDGGSSGPNSETSGGGLSPTPSPKVSMIPTNTTTQIQFDHLSHAVPGFLYSAIDFDGNGKENVDLDGSRSHTHYTYGDPIQQGQLIYLNWFNNETKASIASQAKASVSFPVGTTIVGLTVQDNSLDSHTAYATVVVDPPILSNSFCYYFASESGNDDIVINNDYYSTDDEHKPIFAESHANIGFMSADQFPPEIQSLTGNHFQMRCLFTLTGEEDDQTVSFSITHQGPMKLIVDDEVILESDETNENVIPGSTTISKGYHYAQLIYSKPKSSDGKLVMDMTGNGNDNVLEYDASKLIPVINSIDTLSITLEEAEGKMKIEGINFENGLNVNFDGEVLEPLPDLSTNKSVTIQIPASDVEKRVEVFAFNNAGESNRVDFEYQSDGKPAIVFSETELKLDNGKELDVQLMTGIVYGADHRYYVSAIHSTVYSFEVNSQLEVAADTYCKSASMGKHRTILGLAFNPQDGDDEENFKLYASASVLEWKEKERLSGNQAWTNGEIIIIKKNVDGACLGRTDTIITGLPVTNHDHGVNGIVFDQDGNLHIQVGGFTNAGVMHEERLGGLAANPLSGASLIANINKNNFNGEITYSNYNNPNVADQTGGDVDVYMSGLRNSFAVAHHSNGHLYATDNGASVGFGAKSINCTHEEELTGANLHDELVKVVKGKYGGHPNRNRGRKNANECRFRGPEEKSDGFYQGPIATFESSTNGVMEYTANNFEGQLKSNLLCSKFATQESEGKIFRVQLNDQGDALKPDPDELWDRSGLTIIMSPYGDLLSPRVFGKRIIVLKAKRKSGKLTPTFLAAFPFRGPRKGGNWILITGEDFGAGATAAFNGKKCLQTTEVSSDKRSFKCQVPPAADGVTSVKVALHFDDSRLDVGVGQGTDYLYMNK